MTKQIWKLRVNGSAREIYYIEATTGQEAIDILESGGAPPPANTEVYDIEVEHFESLDPLPTTDESGEA